MKNEQIKILSLKIDIKKECILYKIICLLI